MLLATSFSQNTLIKQILTSDSAMKGSNSSLVSNVAVIPCTTIVNFVCLSFGTEQAVGVCQMSAAAENYAVRSVSLNPKFSSVKPKEAADSGDDSLKVLFKWPNVCLLHDHSPLLCACKMNKH